MKAVTSRGKCGHPLTRRQIGFTIGHEEFTEVCDHCPRKAPVVDPALHGRIMGRIQRQRASYQAWKDTIDMFGRKKLTCDAIISLGPGSVTNPKCGQSFPTVMGDPEETRRLAARKGWRLTPTGDYCPSHA